MRVEVVPVTGSDINDVIFHYTAEEVRAGHARRPYIMSAANMGRLFREVAQRLEDNIGLRSLVLTKTLLYVASAQWANDINKKSMSLPFMLAVQGEEEETQSFNCTIACLPADQKEFKRSPLFSEGFAKSANPTSFVMPDCIERKEDCSESHRFRQSIRSEAGRFLDLNNEDIGNYLLTHLHSLWGTFRSLGKVESDLGQELEKVFLDKSGKVTMVNLKIDHPLFTTLLGGVWSIRPSKASKGLIVVDKKTTERRYFSSEGVSDQPFTLKP